MLTFVLIRTRKQYIPSHGPFIPIAALTTQLPRLSYQIFFDTATPAAIEELEKDVRRTLRGTLRTVKSAPPSAFLESRESFLDGWKEVGEVCSFFICCILKRSLC